MAKGQFPDFGSAVHGGVLYDRHGIGATARSVGDAALWVMMRPTTFLALATPLPRPRASLDWILGEIGEGRSINPPELLVRIGPRDGSVVSHEGRHRATAVLTLEGDAEMPVRIRVQHARDGEIGAAAVTRLRARLRAQRGGPSVEGPLFGDWKEDFGGRPRSGVPPPRISGKRLRTSGQSSKPADIGRPDGIANGSGNPRSRAPERSVGFKGHRDVALRVDCSEST